MELERMNSNTVDSRDAKLNAIYSELIESASMKNHLVLQREVTHRMHVDHIFKEAFGEESTENKVTVPTKFDCYKRFVQEYKKNCAAPNGEGDDLGLGIDEYTMKWFFNFVDYCETNDEYEN